MKILRGREVIRNETKEKFRIISIARTGGKFTITLDKDSTQMPIDQGVFIRDFLIIDQNNIARPVTSFDSFEEG